MMGDQAAATKTTQATGGRNAWVKRQTRRWLNVGSMAQCTVLETTEVRTKRM